MHILLLNWKDIKNPHAGGAEVILFELAKRLVKEKHTVTLFSRSFPNAKPEETIDGVKIIRRGNKLSVYKEAFFFYRNLTKKPDRVIEFINTLCWLTPWYIPREKRILYVNQLAKEVLFYELPFPLSFISYWLERFEYLPYKNTKTLCYSQSTKSDLVSFGIPASNIHIFPVGIDHKKYYPGEKAKQPLFIFVARLVKMKRADVCIEAMKIVKQSYPDAKLAIIGNGPEQETLQRMTTKLNLEKEVLFIDKNNFFLELNNKDKKVAYMQASWALLLPSIKEGWGMVVTEAGACETPSIVTNVTGLKNSVIKNKTGLIISARPSSSELANAMISLIENSNLRKTLSKNAKKYSQEFTWEKSFKEFLKLIK